MTLLTKGYKDDIGVDIVFDYDITFAPFETKVIPTEISIPSISRRSVMMCARTSAAMRGIIVNQCPIDPNYTGCIHVIAHNCSGDTVTFKAGIAFAQLYAFDVQELNLDIKIKCNGVRNNNNFGSTDKEVNKNESVAI